MYEVQTQYFMLAQIINVKMNTIMASFHSTGIMTSLNKKKNEIFDKIF